MNESFLFTDLVPILQANLQSSSICINHHTDFENKPFLLITPLHMRNFKSRYVPSFTVVLIPDEMRGVTVILQTSQGEAVDMTLGLNLPEDIHQIKRFIFKCIEGKLCEGVSVQESLEYGKVKTCENVVVDDQSQVCSSCHELRTIVSGEQTKAKETEKDEVHDEKFAMLRIRQLPISIVDENEPPKPATTAMSNSVTVNGISDLKNSDWKNLGREPAIVLEEDAYTGDASSYYFPSDDIDPPKAHKFVKTKRKTKYPKISGIRPPAPPKEKKALPDFNEDLDYFKIGDNSWECKICFSPFKRGSKMRAHKLKHESLMDIHAEIKCPLCKLSFTKLTLNEHFTAAHKEKEGFGVCVECEEFHPKAELIKHLKQKHKNITGVYSCEFCGRSFIEKNKLEMHRILDHNQEGEPNICSFCGKDYKHKAILQKHVYSLHKDLHGPYDCGKCGKIFVTYTLYRKHIQSHSLVKPYQCNLCKYGAYFSNNMRQHVQKVHHVKEGKEKQMEFYSKIGEWEYDFVVHPSNYVPNKNVPQEPKAVL